MPRAPPEHPVTPTVDLDVVPPVPFPPPICSAVAPRQTTETVMPLILAGVALDHIPTSTELAEVVLDRAERTFGRRADGTLLERYALEAAIDVLSRPAPRLAAYLPDLALRRVRDALDPVAS